MKKQIRLTEDCVDNEVPALVRQSSTKKSLKRRRVKLAGCDEDVTKSAQEFLIATRDLPVKREMRFKPLPAIGDDIEVSNLEETSNCKQIANLTVEDLQNSEKIRYAELDSMLLGTFGAVTEKMDIERVRNDNLAIPKKHQCGDMKDKRTGLARSDNSSRVLENEVATEFSRNKYVPNFSCSENQRSMINGLMPATNENKGPEFNQCPIAFSAMSPMFTRSRLSRSESNGPSRICKNNGVFGILNPRSEIQTSLTHGAKGGGVNCIHANHHNSTGVDESMQSRLTLFGNNDDDGIISPPKRLGRRNIFRSTVDEDSPSSTFKSEERYDPTSLCLSDSKVSSMCVSNRKPRLPRRCGSNKYLPPLTRTLSHNNER